MPSAKLWLASFILERLMSVGMGRKKLAGYSLVTHKLIQEPLGNNQPPEENRVVTAKQEGWKRRPS